MDEKLVETLANEASRLIANAKEKLAAEMKVQGLRREDGWRIVEELRNTVNGTEWTFRPVHLRHDSPELHTKVAIDTEGRPI